MAGVNKEQIAQAKEIDLLTYLQTHEPWAIRKCGRNEYCLKEHDSLKISNGLWHWWSADIGGKNALDFLIHVRGMEFVDAVKLLSNEQTITPHAFRQGRAPPTTVIKSLPPKAFVLPPANANDDCVIAYLQCRGIDKDIIKCCISAGVLYESAKTKNCVFVGFDGDNPKFAALRSVTGDYKQDVLGSDKRYSFSVPTRGINSNTLFCYESPIDALSAATLDKQFGYGDAWDCVHRISLGGISKLALMQYLNDYQKIDKVCLCLDTDNVGQEAAWKIYNQLAKTPHPLGGKYNVTIVPPTSGKDFNDMLQTVLQEKNNHNKHSRLGKRAAISI